MDKINLNALRRQLEKVLDLDLEVKRLRGLLSDKVRQLDEERYNIPYLGSSSLLFALNGHVVRLDEDECSAFTYLVKVEKLDFPEDLDRVVVDPED